MKIYIIGFEGVDKEVLESIRMGLEDIFGMGSCKVLDDVLELPREAYNRFRGQYLSEPLLEVISKRLSKCMEEDCVLLGVTDVDIYAPGMNFIFGLAQFPGRAALISLFRLRPELYGGERDRGLLLERAVKEAVHEVGHLLGLKHCRNQFCVMHFSLHIGMTDRKSKFFCEDCLKRLKYIFRR